MEKQKILKQYFGHSAFRAGQETLIDGILQGRDVLGIMPTGGGKSLCYQIPAMMLPGAALVISPLISLMKDQVSALRETGVDAVFLNSSLDATEYYDACAKIRSGRCRLIYIAPERLLYDGFLELIRSVSISLVAVDEAHCLSQWGQDFRPSYLKIAEFINILPYRPVLAAFTATATQQVRQDIVRLLELEHPVEVITGFDRPNLYFEVQRPKRKLPALLGMVQELWNKSGIVYCATRASVERVCEQLVRHGIPATRYHAGLSDAERRRNQDDFQFDRKTVMVATNAFGMGIDKSNVGFVIHYNMPKSLEAYYQEAGRAGRDGAAADCILLFSSGDVTTAKFLIENGGGNEELTPEQLARIRELDYQRLETMTGYCKTARCLRGYLLDYFGQRHEAQCQNCGNCRGEYTQKDITIQAQMILSCVKRVKDHLGYYVGASLLEKLLHGSKSSRILDLRLDTLSTYGLLKGEKSETIREYLEQLQSAGYLAADPRYSVLMPTAQAAEVLFHGQRVLVTVKLERNAPPAPMQVCEKAVSPDSQTLLARLKALRNQLAQQERVPAYIIFSNVTLEDMAEKAPRTIAEFLQVSGVGEVKASRYGTAFLKVIAGEAEAP